MPDLISVKNNDNRKWTVFVFASLAIAIMALILYLGSLNVRQFEQTVVSDTQERLLTIANTQAEHLEEVVCEIQCDMEALAANPIIKSRIRNKVRGSEIAEGDYRPFQHVFLEERHVVAALYRIDSTGIVQARMPSAEGREGRDYSTKPGVKHILENHTKHGEHIQESYEHVSELFTTASGAYAISVCVPVFEQEEFIGVLRALIYADQLGGIIGDIKVGEQGYAWIIDDGQVLSHPDAEQIGADFMAITREKLPGADWSELEDVVARMRKGEEGVGSYHSVWWTEPNPRMVKKLAAFAPIEIGNEQWSVAVTMEYDEIAGPIARYSKNTLLLGGLLILIFLTGGTALYRVQKKKDELEIIAASAAELESANRKLQTEIRERKQAEEELRESEERYRSLLDDVLDTSEVATFILDSDFNVVWINQALERYFGLDRGQIVGKDKRKLIRENIKGIFEDPDRFTRMVFATYDDNTYIENFECHVLAAEGREERWLAHWSQPIRSGLYRGGRIEHYTDITERKQAEEALTERVKELQCLYGTAESIRARETPEEVFQDVAALIPPAGSTPRSLGER